MTGRVLAGESGGGGVSVGVAGRREELEYLNNLAPCGWRDSSVILEEGPTAREMSACNET